jgi:peroxiredoxin
MSRPSKRFAIALIAVALAALTHPASSRANDVPPVLPIGAQAPDFHLPGIDGKSYRLEDFASSKILVVVFTCVHCPTAQVYENRIKQLVSDYKDKGVGFFAIQPNNPKAVRIGELNYSDLNDSLPEMKIRAQYRKFNFPFLYDGDTQSVAQKYGPVATPHVFVFDKDRKLRYEGRIDSSPRNAPDKTEDARNAIEALLAGKPVPVEKTPSVGCSTKWAYKEASADQEMSQLTQQPVTLDTVTPDQIKALRANQTGKVLLINFWATWCGPCTEEFPQLEKIYAMYRSRPFDMVTVAVQTPEEKDEVLAFLKNQTAISRNLIFSTEEPYPGIEAFGSGWSGAVPFTILIDADGKIVYHNQGEINSLELKRTILSTFPDNKAFPGQHEYWNSKGGE